MFHRALFDLVVFSSDNPRLGEIADMMNARGSSPGCRGFEAVLVSLRPVSDCLRLRHFVAGPIEPKHLAGVLPIRPPTGFLDDTDHFCQKDAKTTSDPLPNEFVQVQRNGSEFKLILRGRFRPDHRYHERLRLHSAYGAFLKPRLSVVCPLRVIVRFLFDGLREAGMIGTSETYGELSQEEDRIFMAIEYFLMRANGRGSYEWEPLNRLRPYLCCWSLSEWYRRINNAMSFPPDLPDANSCDGDHSSDEDEIEPVTTAVEPESAPEDDRHGVIRAGLVSVLSGERSVNEADATLDQRNGSSDAAETEPRPPRPNTSQGPKANEPPPKASVVPGPKASQRPKATRRPQPKANQGQVPGADPGTENKT
jgi:hypothetical protein